MQHTQVQGRLNELVALLRTSCVTLRASSPSSRPRLTPASGASMAAGSTLPGASSGLAARLPPPSSSCHSCSHHRCRMPASWILIGLGEHEG